MLPITYEREWKLGAAAVEAFHIPPSPFSFPCVDHDGDDMPKHAHVMFLNVEGEDVLIYDKDDNGQQIVVH